jgi:hypothetical protein
VPDPFGEAFWPGADNGFVSCSATTGHGVTPGIATLVIPWQDDVTTLANVGDLVIRDGVRDPVVWKGCKLERVDVVGGPNGTRVLSLTILDRRWEWRHGWIDGEFNIPDPYPDTQGLPPGEFVNDQGGGPAQEFQVDWGPFIPGTERTAEDLIALCLDRMGEEEWDIRTRRGPSPR